MVKLSNFTFCDIIKLKYECSILFPAHIRSECDTFHSVSLQENSEIFHKSTDSIKEVMPSLHSVPPLQREVDLAFGLLAV